MIRAGGSQPSRRFSLAVAAIAAAGCAIWMYRLGADDYDWVVAEEVIFARQPLAAILFHNPWPDQSPLPYLVMRLMRTFGESPLAVKLPNAMILVAATVLVAVLARSLRESNRTAIAAAAMFVGSPIAIWCARYGRVMYPLELLLSVLLLLAVWEWASGRQLLWLGALVAAAVLTIYNHLYGFLEVALALLFLIAWTGRDKVARRSIAVALASIAILTAPQILRAAAMTRSLPERTFLSIPSAGQATLRLATFWLNGGEFGVTGLAPQQQRIYLLAFALLFVIGLAAARSGVRFLLALWVLAPLAIVTLAASRIDIRERYYVFSAPALLALAAQGAVGDLRWQAVSGPLVRTLNIVRLIPFIVVLATGVWVSKSKLREPAIEWAALVERVNPILARETTVYACPGYIAPALQVVTERRHLDARLAHPAAWTVTARGEVADLAARRQPIVFIWPAGLPAPAVRTCYDELVAVGRDLEKRGYTWQFIRSNGAAAADFRPPQPESPPR